MKRTTSASIKIAILFLVGAVLITCAFFYAGHTARRDVFTAKNMTPEEIFLSLKGKKALTNGWADMHNSGAGLSYSNPKTFILIDDNTKNKHSAFTAAINSDEEKFIILSGALDLSAGKISDKNKTYFDSFAPTTGQRLHGDNVFKIGSNTTIIGINCARLMFGGFKIEGKSNIIIKNITFYDAYGSPEYAPALNKNSKATIDTLEISGKSDGVWIDGCKFTDGPPHNDKQNINYDGFIDVPQGQNITVSHNEFTNHDKVMLFGADDNALDARPRQITLHHNYFHNVRQRMPRTRGAQVHIYNNYYKPFTDAEFKGYFIGAGLNAELIIENNYFDIDFSAQPVFWWDNKTYPAKVYYHGNKTKDNNTYWYAKPFDKNKPWRVPYKYKLQRAARIKKHIPQTAGPYGCFNAGA